METFTQDTERHILTHLSNEEQKEEPMPGVWVPVENPPLLYKLEAIPSEYVGRRCDCDIEVNESNMMLVYVPLDVGYMYRLAFYRFILEHFPDKTYKATEWVTAGVNGLRVFPTHYMELPVPPPEPQPESQIVVPDNGLILPEGTK